MNQLQNIKNISVDINIIENKFIIDKAPSISILRLDKVHPEVSGNKIFKLYYFLQEAVLSQRKIITFGGAYSNHLAATAAACKIYGIDCIGIVRGEKPKNLSHTLLFCKKQGMRLEFISRENYKMKDSKDFEIKLTADLREHILIPEGGCCKKGVEGAELISNFYSKADYTHICAPVATATTLAGLIKSSLPKQKIIGFSVLKTLDDFENRLESLIGKPIIDNYALINDYHFGGYAKKTGELILFMNRFYEDFKIPTDFVYTAKMMFGIFDLIKKNYFPKGSKILCIHTGGSQGNFSLPPGILNF